MTTFPYTLDDSADATLGLIVLQVDETIEDEFRHYFPPGNAKLHVSRVASGDALTPDTIAAMETSLPSATALLPPAAKFDVVAYACTSGTTLIGAAKVRALVHSATTTTIVTDPMSAALAAAHALGLHRIAILSPYVRSVATPIRSAFEAGGFTIPDMLSFGEAVEARVARITASSIAEAVRTLARRRSVDGVFISCTNLRTRQIIAPLEAELGLPILSSNPALAWQMARMSSVSVASAQKDRLFLL